ncbi:hypothetical protein OAZ06_03185 [Synechococcus sp. AH-736-G20]|nr:hypothetical protein [Synechococcus sp. AH-736-G20]
MAERQLLQICYGDQMLLDELTKFIKGVVSNGSEVSKDEVIAFYGYYPEFERFSEYSSKWKTSTFKNLCTGLGYRVNPDRPNGRWLKTVNGENKDWYLLDAQKAVMKGAESGATPLGT